MLKIKNKKEKLVTIGIASYNRPLTLGRTIDSVLNQSYTNVEILISDDCSPDQEIDNIIQYYCNKDSRVTYIKQEKNIGARKNYALLIEKASGEYFMWLADDDYISDNYIEEVINEFSTSHEYSLIGGEIFFINANKNEKIRKKPCNLLDDNARDRFMKFLYTIETNSIYHSIFRTQDGKDYNMDFYGTDWLHVARLAYKGKVKSLTNIEMYREDAGGESTGHYSYFEIIKIYYNIYSHFKYDLSNSILYKDLSMEELSNLQKKVKNYFLQYLFTDFSVKKVFYIIKKRLLRV